MQRAVAEAIRGALGARSVVFVGMMGSGKSAIGKLVAQRLRLPYFDTDAEIVAAADMSIPEIFEQFGEDEFRRGEQRVIARLLEKGPSVLSLGGGAFMNAATREAIRAHALSIWLKADIDLLLSRVMRRPGSRPLLKTPDPRATLMALSQTRTPVYALADIHVESSRQSRRETADAAVAGLGERLGEHLGERLGERSGGAPEAAGEDS